MQEKSRFVVGVDIGTSTVRCVVGHVDEAMGQPAIVGVGKAESKGMRKGTVVHLDGPAKAIDEALGEAERMSGHQVDRATISVNGSHILSTQASGMIATGAIDHEITHDDIHRVEEVATTGKVPANREILDVVPHMYKLDGQDGIRDPIGMVGTRLEIVAQVVSALTPQVQNIHRAAEMAKVDAYNIVPSVLASAQAVLSESQKENGVAVIDLGAATTGIAVYEEGDLQYVGVVPVGGSNITNDLAIGLKTDPEVAEKVKLKHARAIPRSGTEGISVKDGDEVISVSSKDIDEIVEARLEEIFESIQKQLKRAGRAGKLPSGVVLVGGGAHMMAIDEFAKQQLGVAAKVGKPHGYAGIATQIESSEYAAATGLMLLDGQQADVASHSGGFHFGGGAAGKAHGALSKFLGLFKTS